MGDALKSLKEFIWDIIGYLIPGFLLIILLNLILNTNISIENKFLFDWKLFQEYTAIVISYVLGYIIYSLTRFKITIQDFTIDKLSILFNKISTSIIKILVLNKFSQYLIELMKKKHSEYWKSQAINSSSFLAAKNFLKNQKYTEVDNMKYNEVRNILMSRNPEMDQKVYTFMFRASLFDHISTIFCVIFLLFIIQINTNCNFIKTDLTFEIFYYLIIILIPLLGNSKRFFYSIAQRLPISNLK